MNNKLSTSFNLSNNMPTSTKKNMDVRQILLYIVGIAFSIFTLIDLLGQ